MAESIGRGSLNNYQLDKDKNIYGFDVPFYSHRIAKVASRESLMREDSGGRINWALITCCPFRYPQRLKVGLCSLACTISAVRMCSWHREADSLFSHTAKFLYTKPLSASKPGFDTQLVEPRHVLIPCYDTVRFCIIFKYYLSTTRRPQTSNNHNVVEMWSSAHRGIENCRLTSMAILWWIGEQFFNSQWRGHHQPPQDIAWRRRLKTSHMRR